MLSDVHPLSPAWFAGQVLIGSAIMRIEFHWRFATVAVLAASACTRMDTVERDYADAAALRADGVVSRGWVSDALPASAQQIKLKTNVDTNEAWVKFVAPPADVVAISRSCSRIELQAADLPRTSAGSWWPDYLVGSGFARDRAAYFRCGDGGMFAVPTTEASAYFWRRSQ